MSAARRGTVLLVVAGIAALLATLSAAFLIRMRLDAEQTDALAREAQARVMLIAGCDYVLEASRLGWDGAPPDGAFAVTGAHREGFGWIDVRNGATGPLDQSGAPVWRDPTRFPAPGGRAARCPMHVLRQPPFATRLDVVYNPIPGLGDPDFGAARLTRRDPEPRLTPGATWADWARGDARPLGTSLGLAWFRCWRHREPDPAHPRAGDSPAVFTITCGAGASQGFRDWAEVVAERAEDEFGDRGAFDAIVQAETRRWYDVEWSAAVPAPDFHLLDNVFGEQSSAPHPPGWEGQQPKHIDTYYQLPRNASFASPGRHYLRCQSQFHNAVGTIRWVQRLDRAPVDW